MQVFLRELFLLSCRICFPLRALNWEKVEAPASCHKPSDSGRTYCSCSSLINWHYFVLGAQAQEKYIRNISHILFFFIPYVNVWDIKYLKKKKKPVKLEKCFRIF